ncbi:uncharacterized protein (DUF983 family) [Lederbergia galactosidilyticus]|uniref:hypothetical protein n=1 Tax=Lederbergia galactosidilytica TaxID=217031 RepID=UPI001AE62E9C|nr:hypothetical protein [Lederbergia galactosidilytica]MBP1915913.1 uncharacterized protein (DUF983 family) [Lederbergia galactosidilytica]
MDIIITLVLSFFEWLCLFLFPIMILGYSFKGSYKAMALIAGMMSIFSLLLHHSPLLIPYIIILQILSALLLVRWFFANKMLEAFVITSIGYGFYIFIQMIFMEVLVRAFTWDHFHFFFDFLNKTTIQVLTIISLFVISMIVRFSTYQLNEVRFIIRGPRMNKKYRTLITLISISTIAFICLTVYSLLGEEAPHKQLLILLVMILGFIILSFYLFLHIQFQKQQFLEAKQLFLDQEQRIIDRVENLKEESTQHFQAILKLTERQAYNLITDYIESNQLDKAPLKLSSVSQNVTPQLDELLYSFLINKRKLGQLFGVSIKVSGEVHGGVSISLQQIVCISRVLDDLIYILFRASEEQEKTINFHMDSGGEEAISFTITSPFHIEEKVDENLTYYDAILHLKHLGAIIQSDFQPIKLSIRSPIL